MTSYTSVFAMVLAARVAAAQPATEPATLENANPSVAVEVDGRPLSGKVEPGAHVLTLRADGRITQRLQLDLAAGERLRLDAELATPISRKLALASWIVAGLCAFAAFDLGFAAVHAQDDADLEWPTRRAASLAERDAARMGAIVLGSLAVVGMGVAVWQGRKDPGEDARISRLAVGSPLRRSSYKGALILGHLAGFATLAIGAARAWSPPSPANAAASESDWNEEQLWVGLAAATAVYTIAPTIVHLARKEGRNALLGAAVRLGTPIALGAAYYRWTRVDRGGSLSDVVTITGVGTVVGLLAELLLFTRSTVHGVSLSVVPQRDGGAVGVTHAF